MLKVVLEHALLHRDLRANVEMLHRTAAANVEVRAFRLRAHHAFAEHLHHFGLFELRLAAMCRVAHALAGQRAFDENHLAGRAVFGLDAADAARFHIERNDFDDRLVAGNDGRRSRRGFVVFRRALRRATMVGSSGHLLLPDKLGGKARL